MPSYHISCHCQAHVLKYTVPEGQEPFSDVGVCDCSHCLKRRIVWIMAPKGSVEVVRGVKEGMDSYKFGSKSSAHQFCGTCGTHLLGGTFDSEGNTMFNARAIREPGFRLWDHPLKLYSGLDRDPPYKEITLADLPGAEDYLAKRARDHFTGPTEVHVGSCHCQAIKFAVLYGPLGDNVETTDCACSICLGNGNLWIYPRRLDTFFHRSASPDTPHLPDTSKLIEYGWGPKENLHYMCRQCGCQVYEYRANDAQRPNPEDQEIGLNIALLADAGDYLGDILGLDREQEEYKGKKLGGLQKGEDWATREPVYKLRL